MSWFLLLLLHPGQIFNNLYLDRASTRYIALYTITCYQLPINLVPRNTQLRSNLYLASFAKATAAERLQKLRRTSLTAAGARILYKSEDTAPASVHSVTLTNHTARTLAVSENATKHYLSEINNCLSPKFSHYNEFYLIHIREKLKLEIDSSMYLILSFHMGLTGEGSSQGRMLPRL